LPDWRRYLLEVGVGIDLHGEDVTKAAQRAVKDAISHSSMIGLREILRIKGKQDLDEQNTDLSGIHGVVLANAVIVVMFDAERSRLALSSSK